jgi:hypothetical protein
MHDDDIDIVSVGAPADVPSRSSVSDAMADTSGGVGEHSSPDAAAPNHNGFHDGDYKIFRLKQAFDAAVASGAEQFTLEGDPFLVSCTEWAVKDIDETVKPKSSGYSRVKTRFRIDRARLDSRIKILEAEHADLRDALEVMEDALAETTALLEQATAHRPQAQSSGIQALFQRGFP